MVWSFKFQKIYVDGSYLPSSWSKCIDQRMIVFSAYLSDFGRKTWSCVFNMNDELMSVCISPILGNQWPEIIVGRCSQRQRNAADGDWGDVCGSRGGEEIAATSAQVVVTKRQGRWKRLHFGSESRYFVHSWIFSVECNNCFLSYMMGEYIIGTGGEEASLFALDIFKMYDMFILTSCALWFSWSLYDVSGMNDSPRRKDGSLTLLTSWLLTWKDTGYTSLDLINNPDEYCMHKIILIAINVSFIGGECINFRARCIWSTQIWKWCSQSSGM